MKFQLPLTRLAVLHNSQETLFGHGYHTAEKEKSTHPKNVQGAEALYSNSDLGYLEPLNKTLTMKSKTLFRCADGQDYLCLR